MATIKCPDHGDCKYQDDKRCLFSGRCVDPIQQYTYEGMEHALNLVRSGAALFFHPPGNHNGTPGMVIHTSHGKYRIEAYPVE